MILRTRQPGMTLLELTLAMAMIAMLAGSLYACLRIGFRSRETALAAVGPSRAANVAMEMLRKDLESALPPTGILAGSFVGINGSTGAVASSALQFYCVAGRPHELDPMEGGMRRVEISVVTLEDGRSAALVRRVSGNLLAPMEEEPSTEVLCRGVRAFALRYFDGAVWQDVWDSTMMENLLPPAVQVELELGWPPDKDPPDTIYRTTRLLTLPCYTDSTQSGDTSGAAGTSSAGGSTGGATGGGSSRGGSSGGSAGGSSGGSRGGGR